MEIWYQHPAHKIFQDLNTSKGGISEDEASKRLKKEGFNSFPEEKKTTSYEILLSQIRNPLIYILFFASIVSIFLQDYLDAGVILLAVTINVLLGFVQEYKAQNALEKLREVITLKTLVFRDNGEKEINAEFIVPGDVVIIQSGDKIPADIRIFEAKNLKINEAMLTGESMPSEKTEDVFKENLSLGDQKNMAFMGTEVVEGWGKGVVVETGIKTEVGKIAGLIQEAPREATPLQKTFSDLSRQISLIVLSVCVLIFFIGLWLKVPLTQMFTTSVALSVAAIPEGLAIAVTVILAIGMNRILKEKALVRKLLAAETLGSTTVICSDKTGTLTKGEMRVAEIFTDNVYSDSTAKELFFENNRNKEEELVDLMDISVLCNDAFIENPQDELSEWKVRGNSTERALILAGAELGFHKNILEKEMPRIDMLPFDSSNKFMLTLHRYNQQWNLLFMKGAPEKVLDWCTEIKINHKVRKITKEDRETIHREITRMATKGLRIIGLMYQRVPSKIEIIPDISEIKQNFVWIGLLGIKDPLREEAKETLDICKHAGIRVVIVTGDYKITAKSIMEELGFQLTDENIVEGEQLRRLTDEELRNSIYKIHLFARVSPEDKIRIVNAFQSRGEVVAMTGDGINDAPALKKANVGIVLGSGTEVAKATADVVLLDDNFAAIVSAVKQGRVIYDNIRKIVFYLLSGSFSEVVVVLGALMLGIPIPLTAAQILWINLITDGFPYIALTVEPAEKGIMDEKPRKHTASILSREIKLFVFLISGYTGMVGIFLFYLTRQLTGDLYLARTLVFAFLGTSSILYVFSCRSLRLSLFRINPLTNKTLVIAAGMAFGIQLLSIYSPFLRGIVETVPLSLSHWGVILGLSLSELILIEIAKYIFISVKDKTTVEKPLLS